MKKLKIRFYFSFWLFVFSLPAAFGGAYKKLPKKPSVLNEKCQSVWLWFAPGSNVGSSFFINPKELGLSSGYKENESDFIIINAHVLIPSIERGGALLIKSFSLREAIPAKIL